MNQDIRESGVMDISILEGVCIPLVRDRLLIIASLFGNRTVN